MKNRLNSHLLRLLGGEFADIICQRISLRMDLRPILFVFFLGVLVGHVSDISHFIILALCVLGALCSLFLFVPVPDEESDPEKSVYFLRMNAIPQRMNLFFQCLPDVLMELNEFAQSEKSILPILPLLPSIVPFYDTLWPNTKMIIKHINTIDDQEFKEEYIPVLLPRTVTILSINDEITKRIPELMPLLPFLLPHIDELLESEKEVDTHISEVLDHFPLLAPHIGILLQYKKILIPHMISLFEQMDHLAPYMESLVEDLELLVPHLPWLLDHFESYVLYLGVILEKKNSIFPYLVQVLPHFKLLEAHIPLLLGDFLPLTDLLPILAPHLHAVCQEGCLDILLPHIGLDITVEQLAFKTPYLMELLARLEPTKTGVLPTVQILMETFIAYHATIVPFIPCGAEYLHRLPTEVIQKSLFERDLLFPYLKILLPHRKKIEKHLPQLSTQIEVAMEHFDVVLPHIPALMHNADVIMEYLDDIMEHFDELKPHVPELLIHLDIVIPLLSQVVPHAKELIPYCPDFMPHLEDILPYADQHLEELMPYVPQLAPRAAELAPHAKELLPHIDRLLPFMDEFIQHMDTLIPKLGTTIPHIDALVTYCGFLLKHCHGLLEVPIVMSALPALGEVLSNRAESKQQQLLQQQQQLQGTSATGNAFTNWFNSIKNPVAPPTTVNGRQQPTAPVSLRKNSSVQ